MDTKTPTKMQVKKLLKANNIAIDAPVDRLDGAGTKWELEIFDEKKAEKVRALLPNVGGYTTGYGAMILKPDYQDKGDWNDKSSRWHY